MKAQCTNRLCGMIQGVRKSQVPVHILLKQYFVAL